MKIFKLNRFFAGIRQKISPLMKKLLPARLVKKLGRQMDSLTTIPSIFLILENMDNIPPVVLPEDYEVTHLKSGEESEFVNVIKTALRERASLEWFQNEFMNSPDYTPDKIVLIRYKGRTVCAGTAWQKEWEGEEIGFLPWGAVLENHRGVGLGRALTVHVLHTLKERGYKKAMTTTEDFRTPVIHLLLDMGFKPYCPNKEHEKRWDKILKRIEEVKVTGYTKGKA
jgi:ribosomal protein S18 acetylase RimI-like enzyme